MNKEYHAIFLGGDTGVIYAGKIIAGARLRTALKNKGYELLILESALLLSQEQMLEVLENIITDKTLVIGFSLTWLSSVNCHIPNWANPTFFTELRTRFPNTKLVAGSPSNRDNSSIESQIIYNNVDWIFKGFSDDSFPRLLDLLSGKPAHGLRYMLEDDKKVVYSDRDYKITRPDDLETVWEEGDEILPHQSLPLEVSRGCIFQCAYCTHPFQGAKDADEYIRTPQSIASELQRNYELFGTTRYTLMDDTFNDSIEKLTRLEEAIKIAKLPTFEFAGYIKPELLATKPEMIDRLKDLGLRGAFLGIESLDPISRKAVGRGMKVERFMPALEKLKSNGARLHASFIAGLPNDTPTSIVNSYRTISTGGLFNSWYFYPLVIYYNRKLEGASDLDLNPEKFGYEVKKFADTSCKWKTAHMDSEMARRITKLIKQMSMMQTKPGGWHVASAWNLGFTNNELDTRFFDLRFQLRIVDYEVKKLEKTLAKYVNKPTTLDVINIRPGDLS
jgi:hypothetical protein